jgi:hypothetical protein
MCRIAKILTNKAAQARSAAQILAAAMVARVIRVALVAANRRVLMVVVIREAVIQAAVGVAEVTDNAL